MAASYAELATVRSRLGLKADDRVDDRTISAIVEAASRTIDARCGRVFYPTSGSRLFKPEWADMLIIDDATAITKVEFDRDDRDVWTEITSGWVAEPALMKPYTTLRMRAWSIYAFTEAVRVRVTATWGYPLPPEVREACLLIASRLFKRKDAPFGVSGSPEMGGFRLSKLDPDVETLLAPFVRIRVGLG